MEKLTELRTKGERFLVFYVPLRQDGVPFHCIDMWCRACERALEGRTNCIFVGYGYLREAVVATCEAMPAMAGDAFFFENDQLDEVLAIGDVVFVSEGCYDFNACIRTISQSEQALREKAIQPIQGPAISLNTIPVTRIGGSTFPKNPIA